MLRRITLPDALNPVPSLEKTKSRLNILHEDWDEDIRSLIVAANESYTTETGIALQVGTYEFQTDCWADPITLPVNPVRSIDSVKYIDNAGAEQTVSTDDWYFVRDDGGGAVWFNRSFNPPYLDITNYRPDAVRVRFQAGYDAPDAVTTESDLTLPEAPQLAVMFLVGTWLDNRESVASEKQAYEVPGTFKYLAAQSRIYR